MNSGVHRLVCLLVALAGVLLSLSIFLELEEASERDLLDDLRGQAFERMLQIERTIQQDLTALRAFRGLFEASERVDREAFRRFRESIVLAPSVFALSWAPRVPAVARAEFESLVRAQISPAFQVWELGDDNGSVPAAGRSEYFPVLFSERNVPGDRIITGFDVTSLEVRRRAAEAARLTGEMVATPPIPLITATSEAANGFLVIAPVFEGRSLPPLMRRLDQTEGLVIGVFEISKFVREAFGAGTLGDTKLSLRIFDRTDMDEARPIFVSGENAQGSGSALDQGQLLAKRIFDVAGRQWDVIVSIDHIPGHLQHWTPWFAAIVGLMLTFALVTVLHLAHGRRDYAERIADERTEELVRVADRLNAEISERTSVQRELLRSRERLQDSIESLDDGFALYDANYRLILWNHKYHDFDREIASSLAPGVAFADLAQAGIDAKQWKEPPVPSSCRPGALTLPSVRERQLRDGRWLLVKLQNTSEGGLVDIRTDISTLKARAAELEDHRDRLQDLVADRTRELEAQAVKLLGALEKEREFNALQSEFVSMVSHEFRTPLAIIDGAAQRIQRKARDLSPEDLTGRVERIRDAVRRLITLIESTLSFSRIEAGCIVANLQDFDLVALLSEVCEQQQQLTTSHEVVDRLGALPRQIHGDPDLLRQVFSNLLSNAVKYSPDADRVEIKGERRSDKVQVSVRDYGLGIPEDDLPRLFSRFFRASNVTGIAGTGIGLSLCRALLEAQGGTIDVQSTEGEGSLFTVRLPVRAADAADASDDLIAQIEEAS